MNKLKYFYSSRKFYFLRPRLKEFNTTLTLEKAIAALASIGFNNMP